MIETNIVKRLKARQSQMEDQRQPAETLYDEINNLLLPNFTPYIDDISEGEEITQAYHTGPPRHLRTCADGMQGYIVSEHIDWFDYQMADRLLSQDDNVRAWLQECKEYMLGRFRNSNFYKVLPTHFRAGLALGNSAVLSSWDWKLKKIVYKVPHPKQGYWILDNNGEVKVYHRKYQMTAEQALSEFGLDKLSQKIKTAIENNKPFDKFWFLICICKRDDSILKGYKVQSGKEDWIQMYVDMTDSESSKPLKESWFYICPASVWMYEHDDGENYGRGIGHLAIADIRGLNEMRASMLTGVQKEVDQPIIAPTELKGQINTFPNGITYADPNQATGIKPLYSRGINYAAGKDMSSEIEQAVKEWCNVDFFLMLNDLVRREGAPPTATQIVEMAGEKSTLMISRVGRLTSGSLDNLMKRAFILEYQYGDLPEPPDIIIEKNAGIPQVDYVGPLAQAQKLSHSVRRISNAIGTITPILNIDPMTIHKVRWSKVLERQLESQNFYQQDIVPEEEYQKIVAAIREQESQMQQLAMAKDIADTVPSLQKETKKGSPMEIMTK